MGGDALLNNEFNEDIDPDQMCVPEHLYENDGDLVTVLPRSRQVFMDDFDFDDEIPF